MLTLLLDVLILLVCWSGVGLLTLLALTSPLVSRTTKKEHAHVSE